MEMVGGEGYPNGDKFYFYYLSQKNGPRQARGIPYGALLMRIGRDGPIKKVGRGRRFTADAAGQLYFDINESAVRVNKRPWETARSTIWFVPTNRSHSR